jgi:hypothetical protein
MHRGTDPAAHRNKRQMTTHATSAKFDVTLSVPFKPRHPAERHRDHAERTRNRLLFRMRSFFKLFSFKRYRHAHGGTVAARLKIKPSPDQLHSLLHA